MSAITGRQLPSKRSRVREIGQPSTLSPLGQIDQVDTNRLSREKKELEHEEAPNLLTHGEGMVEPEEVLVCQMRSISQYAMHIQVNDKSIKAVVDTAAQVTIISDRVFKSLKNKPKQLRTVKLLAAGRDMGMSGFVAGPVRLRIGSKWYSENVYVAPIEQDMLLGFDILHGVGRAILDLAKGMLYFDGMCITLDGDAHIRDPQVARITVARRRVVPPNSVAQIHCNIDRGMSDYVIEPVGKYQGKLLIPRVIREGNSHPIMCVVNPSDRYRLLAKGKDIGRAYPVEEYLQGHAEAVDQTDSTEPVRVNSVENKGDSAPGLTDPQSIESRVPEHIRQMYNDSCKHLDQAQSDQFAQLLIDNQGVFAKDEFDLGNFSAIEHTIDTGDSRPVRQRMRRTPVGFAEEEEAHLEKMLKAGVIQESTSDWASAPVLIRKRDGTVRWCIDYRGLNNVSAKDVFPLPLVDDCLDTLAGSEWFSKLDANSAYWQVPIREEDRKKTAFITKYGLFEHVRMGFGLCGAPATYARIMNLVFRGMTWKLLLAFLDDILVLGSYFNEHLQNLREALSRFRHFGLKLKPKKCIFFQKEVEFLGRNITGNSLEMSEHDIQVVRDWPTPTTAKEVESFMGLANYHRAFVKDFSKLAVPLYAVTGKKNYQWTETQSEAFNALRQALISPPVLALPSVKDEFILDTDASNFAIGAELLQIQGGVEKVVAYGSFALTKEQRRYCTTRKELLAVVRFTRQYRHYLLGKPFVVRTDHSSLRWLMRFKEPQGQLARWLEELSQYNMVLQHRAGREHCNADTLSRRPAPSGECGAVSVGIRLGEDTLWGL